MSTAQQTYRERLKLDPALTLKVMDYDGTNLHLEWTRELDTLFNRSERKLHGDLSGLPQCVWSGTNGKYSIPCTGLTCQWIDDNFPDTIFAEPELRIPYDFALMAERGCMKRAEIVTTYIRDKVAPKVVDYQFKRQPMTHQTVAFECARLAPFYGLLMQMGTGKTKVIADLLSYFASKHTGAKPYRALIICPRSVVVNWVRELDKDVTVPYAIALTARVGRYVTPELEAQGVCAIGRNDLSSVEAVLTLLGKKDVKLHVCIANYDALKARLDLFKKLKFDHIVLDESHRIKSPSAKRTRFCLELAETCTRRHILTGTPLTQSPLDLYSQFDFLGPKMGLLGYTTFYAYHQAYAQTGGYKGRKVVAWTNTGKLMEHAARWSFTVRKEDCLDLPPKVYERRSVDMTEQQRDIYEQVATEVLLVLESLGAEVSIQNILVQYLRLAQVTSGYVKSIEGKEIPIPDSAVKIDALVDVLEEAGWPKTIVWARFTHEIKAIYDRLTSLGVNCVKYFGAVSDEDRQSNLDSFAHDDNVKVFIGNAQTGGEGVDLSAAALVVYVSNDFSLQRRLQSEDRCHRIGQTKSVTYVDLVCEDSIDELVLARLGLKREMAGAFSDPTELASSLKDFLLRTTTRRAEV